MLRSKPLRPIRTTIDLEDTSQIKSMKKRLGISEADLVRIVDRIGNSVAAIQKEVDRESGR